MWQRPASLACLSVALLGCGGLLSASGDGHGGNDDAGGDSAANAEDAGAGHGWTQCAAPTGDHLCGREGTPCACGPSPSSCAQQSGSCDCLNGAELIVGQPDDISICATSQIDQADFYDCPDGQIMLMAPTTDWKKPGDVDHCAPFDFGVLYAKNGWAKAVRYVDWAPFTGDPLPTPSTCPQVQGIQLCGGPCGNSCPDGSVCTGRSPLHPYSVCLPVRPPNSPGPGGTGWGCFAFALPSPQDQALAKAAWNSVPGDWCQAAAKNLPGGGVCSIPQLGQSCL